MTEERDIAESFDSQQLTDEQVLEVAAVFAEDKIIQISTTLYHNYLDTEITDETAINKCREMFGHLLQDVEKIILAARAKLPAANH